MATRKRTSKKATPKKRLSAKQRAIPARREPTPRGVVPAAAGKAMAEPAAGLSHALSFDPMRHARDLIRDIPDFPKPGILFKDLTPLLADPKGIAYVVDSLASRFIGEPVDAVVGVEARGFIVGALIAARLNAGFIPVRKPGKLPATVDSISYSLEYGEAELQMHRDSIESGARVLVVDDLLATGGTASAAGELVRRRGGQVLAYVFAVELVGLSGRKALEPTPVISLLQFE